MSSPGAAAPATAPAAAFAPPPPMTGMPLAVTALMLALGTFMQVLDSTIANVSLPTIAGNLGVSPDQGTWVITAFAVSNGIGVPLTGWLMGRYGVVQDFRAVGAGLHHRVFSLRHRLEFAIADFLPRAARRRLRPDDSRLPGAADFHFPVRQARDRAGPVVDHHFGGADLRSDPGRLYLRQFPLGLDLLINVPVGLAVTWMCWGALKTRETPTRKLPIDTVGLGLLIVWVYRTVGYIATGPFHLRRGDAHDHIWPFALRVGVVTGIVTVAVVTVYPFIEYFADNAADHSPGDPLGPTAPATQHPASPKENEGDDQGQSPEHDQRRCHHVFLRKSDPSMASRCYYKSLTRRAPRS